MGSQSWTSREKKKANEYIDKCQPLMGWDSVDEIVKELPEISGKTRTKGSVVEQLRKYAKERGIVFSVGNMALVRYTQDATEMIEGEIKISKDFSDGNRIKELSEILGRTESSVAEKLYRTDSTVVLPPNYSHRPKSEPKGKKTVVVVGKSKTVLDKYNTKPTFGRTLPLDLPEVKPSSNQEDDVPKRKLTPKKVMDKFHDLMIQAITEFESVKMELSEALSENEELRRKNKIMRATIDNSETLLKTETFVNSLLSK